MVNDRRYPAWDEFAEREVPPMSIAFMSPGTEIMSLLQNAASDLKQLQAEKEQREHELLAALAEQAVSVFQLETRLLSEDARLTEGPARKFYRAVNLIKETMSSKINAQGMVAENPLGQPYESVQDRVQVQGWVQRAELTEAQVIEVQEPIITYRGFLIRPGRVTMGEPLFTPEQERAVEPNETVR